MRKVTLGGRDRVLNSIKIEVGDYNTGEIKEVPLFDKDGTLARNADAGGFAVTLDIDELAQSIAFLRDDTDGKVGADDILKSMFRYSPNILGEDEPFKMGITILNELVKRTTPNSSENLALKCALANLKELQ